MEWQQLEYFRAVAQREHVTRAAEDLSVSQSAVSRSIAQLEEELGVALFDRRGRSVVLNRYGKMFLRHVDRARAEIEEGRRELADATGSMRGIVALGFLHSLGTEVVPRIIRAFRKTHPDVEFQLAQNYGGILMNQLHAGEIDLCMSVPGFFERGNETWTALVSEELVATLPARHRLADRATIRLEELANEPFVVMKTDHTLRAIVDKLCQDAGFTPHISFEGGEQATLRGLVSAGLGVAILPVAHSKNEEVREVRLRPKATRKIGIGWIEERYMSEAVSEFRDFVLAWSREHLAA